MGRYCWKSFPKILHILAQAEIRYESYNTNIVHVLYSRIKIMQKQEHVCITFLHIQ